MSSASDKTVFEESVEGQDNVNLFESKKWTYITDSTSSNGQFSGQIQFDLNTLSSQNQWTDLSQAVITFPVKLSIKNNVAAAPAAATINSATIKNGFHNFVDSVQIVIGSTTVQSSQIFQNVDTSYKILTEWSQDTLKKYGSTLGVSLDDIVPSTDTTIGVAESVDNLPLFTAASATQGLGFDIVNARNPGFKERCAHLNNNVSSSTLGKSILSTNQSILGKGNVQSDATVATANSDVFVLYAVGTIRLKDISDSISKMPLVKGLKGFIYLNYNSSTSIISNTGASSTITSVSSSATFGRCCPAVYNVGTDGCVLNASGTAPVTFTADINATTSNLSTAVPTQQNAVLYAPYYIATPEVDRALTFRKTIRYNERFVTQFSLAASGNYTATLSPGISNPKRVILYPYFTGAGSSGNTSFLTNPLLSPFDGVPVTTSPFAALKDLQLYVGNVPMFQQPVNMDWQTFSNEVAQNGLDGGLIDQAASGLLSQRTWNQLYRYYTVDVGRRMNSEDGASKSIQISCTNATQCPMTVIAIIWYEREISVDTASGMITQGM
jgi:hypothetical protein